MTYRKGSLCSTAIFDETNAAKRKGLFAGHFDPQGTQRRHAFGHDPLAAGFIDRRSGMIGQCDGESALPGRNGPSQAGGSSTNDEYLGIHARLRSL
jgi:hypothetical protein